MKNEIKYESDVIRQGRWTYFPKDKSAMRDSWAGITDDAQTVDLLFEEAPDIYYIIKEEMIKASRLSKGGPKNE